MLWLLGFVLIITGIFSYLLVAPFYLEINSLKDLYSIRFHRLVSAKLITADSSLKIDLNITGWHKQIDLLSRSVKKEKKSTKTNKKRQLKISFNKIRSVISTFKVNECYITTDLGDVQINGILFPVLYLLGKHIGKTIEINFLNKNIIILEIENNFATMIWAYIFH